MIAKKFNQKRETSARIFAWLILLSVLSGMLQPVFGQKNLNSSDLVFCPLQKTWVEKYIPKSKIKVREPLADICGSQRTKEQFFFEVGKKVPLLRFIPNSKTAENLFFSYLEKRKQSLIAKLIAPYDAPERKFETAAVKQQSAANNFQISFDRTLTQVFTLSQAARPPTAHGKVSFETAVFVPLEKISRRIAPRAPPAFSL